MAGLRIVSWKAPQEDHFSVALAGTQKYTTIPLDMRSKMAKPEGQIRSNCFGQERCEKLLVGFCGRVSPSGNPSLVDTPPLGWVPFT